MKRGEYNMGNDSKQFRSHRTTGYRGQLSRWPALTVAFLIILGFAHVAAAATISVNTTNQQVNDDGDCSLQEAIYSANFDNNIAIDTTNPDHFVTTDCEPGSGDDTIWLAQGAVFHMGSIVDDAYNYTGPTATPIVFSNIIIEANGSLLEHIQNGVNFRAFAVGIASIDVPSEFGGGTKSGSGNLTIRNAYIRGFTVKGGNGADGGGGGGVRGAIYVNAGTLTIESCTFTNNGATRAAAAAARSRPEAGEGCRATAAARIG
jgi:hypothetical protein